MSARYADPSLRSVEDIRRELCGSFTSPAIDARQRMARRLWNEMQFLAGRLSSRDQVTPQLPLYKFRDLT